MKIKTEYPSLNLSIVLQTNDNQVMFEIKDAHTESEYAELFAAAITILKTALAAKKGRR